MAQENMKEEATSIRKEKLEEDFTEEAVVDIDASHLMVPGNVVDIPH